MKYFLLILAFFVLLGIHQTTQTQTITPSKTPKRIKRASLKNTSLSQTNEREEAQQIKAKLDEVKDAMLEKRLLHELWRLTRNKKQDNNSLDINLYIAIKDTKGKHVHINQRQQGHIAHITLGGYTRGSKRVLKWQVEIKHRLVDMNNLSELMYE